MFPAAPEKQSKCRHARAPQRRDSGAVDERRDVRGSEAIVDVHHRDVRGARVQHREQRRDTAEATHRSRRWSAPRSPAPPPDRRPPTRARPPCRRPRSRPIASRRARQRREQPVQPGHARVVDALDLVAEQLGDRARPPRRRAGRRCRPTPPRSRRARAARRGAWRRTRAARVGVVLELGNAARTAPRPAPARRRVTSTFAARCAPARATMRAIWSTVLPVPSTTSGMPDAQRAVRVDARVAELYERQPRERLDQLLARQLAAREALEQRVQPIPIHRAPESTLGCASLRAASPLATSPRAAADGAVAASTQPPASARSAGAAGRRARSAPRSSTLRSGSKRGRARAARARPAARSRRAGRRAASVSPSISASAFAAADTAMLPDLGQDRERRDLGGLVRSCRRRAHHVVDRARREQRAPPARAARRRGRRRPPPRVWRASRAPRAAGPRAGRAARGGSIRSVASSSDASARRRVAGADVRDLGQLVAIRRSREVLHERADLEQEHGRAVAQDRDAAQRRRARAAARASRARTLRGRRPRARRARPA